jgi:hypothetical protein
VRSPVLFGRPHVEQRHFSGPDALDQPTPVDGLETASLLDEGASDLLNLHETVLAEAPQRPDEIRDAAVGDPVGHEHTSLLRFDETGVPQDLEMLGGIRKREAGFLGKRLYGTRPLREQVEKGEARATPESVPDPRKLLIQRMVGRHMSLN